MDSLGEGNHTAVREFILLGLTNDPTLQSILFVIILCIYLVTICDKNQHPFLIKTLQRVGIEGNYLNIIKAIYTTDSLSVVAEKPKFDKSNPF